MESSKSDELTSTMGNVLSTSNKEEKSDSSDATPTSSTDANTNPTASQTVSEDPISSTSSDSFDQKPSTMNKKVVDGQITKIPSADNVNELLEMPMSNEKITEDVEDLVHDLESLLGDTSQSFDAPIKPTPDDNESLNEVTEKDKDVEGIKNSEQFENNTVVDAPDKDCAENDLLKNKESCNQTEKEHIAAETSSQAPVCVNNEKEVEENPLSAGNIDDSVDITIDNKDRNDSKQSASEEQVNESTSEVDNSIMSNDVDKDNSNEDDKNNDINEQYNEDSTGSWELVDPNEAMELESSVSSTPSENIEEPKKAIANSQNVVDAITSSNDKPGTSLLSQDTEENSEADSIQQDVTDQIDGKGDLHLIENTEKSGKVNNVTSIDEGDKDTQSDNPKVEVSEDKCDSESKGLEETSCEAEAVPSQVEESQKTATTEETKNVESPMEISSSEACAQPEESKPKNMDEEASNLEAVGSSDNPKQLKDIVNKCDNLVISKGESSCTSENSTIDNNTTCTETINVNNLDAAMSELAPETIQSEDKAKLEVVVVKDPDLTSHIVKHSESETAESIGDTNVINEKPNLDIIESVKKIHDVNYVDKNVIVGSIQIEKSNVVDIEPQEDLITDLSKDITMATKESEVFEKHKIQDGKLAEQETNNTVSSKDNVKCDSGGENEDNSKTGSKVSERKSIENLSELQTIIGDAEPMDTEPAEELLNEAECSRKGSENHGLEPMKIDQPDTDSIKTDQEDVKTDGLGLNNSDETDSEITQTKSREIQLDTNIQKDLEVVSVEKQIVEPLAIEEKETALTTKRHSDTGDTDQETIGKAEQEVELANNVSRDIEQNIADVEHTENVKTVQDVEKVSSHLIEPEKVNCDADVDTNLNITEMAKVTEGLEVNDIEAKTDIKMDVTEIKADVKQIEEGEKVAKETEHIKEDVKTYIKEISEAVEETEPDKTDVEEKEHIRPDLTESQVLMNLQEHEEVKDDIKMDVMETNETKSSVQEAGESKLSIQQEQTDTEMIESVKSDTEPIEISGQDTKEIVKTQQQSEEDAEADQNESLVVHKDDQDITKSTEVDSDPDQDKSELMKSDNPKNSEAVETEDSNSINSEKATDDNSKQIECESVTSSAEKSEPMETGVIVSEHQIQQQLSETTDIVETQTSDAQNDTKDEIDLEKSGIVKDITEENTSISLQSQEVKENIEVILEEPQSTEIIQDSIVVDKDDSRSQTIEFSEKIEDIEGESSGIIKNISEVENVSKSPSDELAEKAVVIMEEEKSSESIKNDQDVCDPETVKDNIEGAKDVTELQTEVGEEESSESIEGMEESDSIGIIKNSPEANENASKSQTEELPEKTEDVMEQEEPTELMKDDRDVSKSQDEELSETIKDMEASELNEAIKESPEADKSASKSQTEELPEKTEDVMEQEEPTELTKDDSDMSKSQGEELSETNKDIKASELNEAIKDSPEADKSASKSQTEELPEKTEDVMEQEEPTELTKDDSDVSKSQDEELSETIKDIKASELNEAIKDSPEADKSASQSQTEELLEKTEDVMEPEKSTELIEDDKDVSASQGEEISEKIEDMDISEPNVVIKGSPKVDENTSQSPTEEFSEKSENLMEEEQSSELNKNDEDNPPLQTEVECSDKIEGTLETEPREVIKDSPEAVKDMAKSPTEELPDKTEDLIKESQSIEIIKDDKDTSEASTDDSKPETTDELSHKIEEIPESHSDEPIEDSAQADKDVLKPQNEEISEKHDSVEEQQPPQVMENEAEAEKDVSEDLPEKIETVSEVSQSREIIKDHIEPSEICQDQGAHTVHQEQETRELNIESGKHMEVIDLDTNQNDEKMEVEPDAKSVSENDSGAEVLADDTVTVLETTSEISDRSEDIVPSEVSNKSSGDKEVELIDPPASDPVNTSTSESNDDIQPMEVLPTGSSTPPNVITVGNLETGEESNENSDLTGLPESKHVSDTSIDDRRKESSNTLSSEQVNESSSEMENEIKSTEILSIATNSSSCNIDTADVKTIKESNEEPDLLKTLILPKGVDLIPVPAEDRSSNSTTEYSLDNQKQTESKSVKVVDERKEIIATTVKDKLENKPATTTRKSLAELELAPLQLSEDDDSEEETVPRLALTPEESVIPSSDSIEVLEPLPQIEQMLEDDKPVFIQTVAPALIDTPDNLETILAVQSLQNIDIPKQDESNISDKERREMEALAMAVQSITDPSNNSYIEDYMTQTNESECLIQEDLIETQEQDISMIPDMEPVQESMIDTNNVLESTSEAEQTVESIAVDESDEVKEVESEQLIQDNTISCKPTEIETSNSNQQTETEGTVSEIANIEQQGVTEPSTSDVAPGKSSEIEPAITTSMVDEATNSRDKKEVSLEDTVETSEAAKKTADRHEDSVTSITDAEEISEAVTSADNVDDSVKESGIVTSIADTVEEEVAQADSGEDHTKDSEEVTSVTGSVEVVDMVTTADSVDDSTKESITVTSATNTVEVIEAVAPADTVEDSTKECDIVSSGTDLVETAETEKPAGIVKDSVKELSAIQEPEIDSAPDGTNNSTEVIVHTTEESLVSEDPTSAEDPTANESPASTSKEVILPSKSKEEPETNFKEEEKSTLVTTTENKDEEIHRHSPNEVLKHNKEKPKSSEKSRKHRKSERSDNFEELTINVDVPEKEKTYSPKVTIKPIKVPDEEVSTTTSVTAESEVSKGSLKMTITKQSDNTHSILKISEQEHSEAVLENEEEPIPKLIIKPKMQQVEQQHSPKMSTRSSKHSPTTSNQSAISPRITIKPVIKQQEQPVSPLKIKINTKVNTKVAGKDDEGNKKNSVKSAAKSNEEPEQLQSPRITIKPIPKPDSEKETNPRLTIKPIKKSDEDVGSEEKERTSPKITIKPIVKPQELEPAPSHDEEEVKERIVLKINKGNLPASPVKDSKKREHPPDEDKSERLAKITVKFSKEGGHHIVQQQGDENPLKRPQEESPVSEKNKKQKVDTDPVVSIISTRSSRNKEHHEGSENKSNTEVESKTSKRDQSVECPIETKRSRKENINDKLKQKENDHVDNVQIIESKLDSPITISEDSRSQDSGSVILLDDSKDDSMSSVDIGKSANLKESLPVAKSNTPSPLLRKRGRPKRSLSPAADQKEVETIAEKELTVQTSRKKTGRGRKTITPPRESEPEPVAVAVETVSETDSATASPVPKKKMGRPRKVPLEPQEDFKNPEESKSKEAEKVQPVVESGRPKRSCRGGQSICDTLGIKPRKSRGSGRGRGSTRGVGNRSLTERDSFTGTLKEEEIVSTSGKEKNPKPIDNILDKPGISDQPKIGKTSLLSPTREVIVILDEAIPDKKLEVKEKADAIRKSTEKCTNPEVIEILSEDSQLSEKGSETAQNVKETPENPKEKQEEPVQFMEVDSVQTETTETNFEKKIPLHEEKVEIDTKVSSIEKDELETTKSVLDADGKSPISILAPPAIPKLFSQLGTSLPKSSNPEISSVSCSSTSIPSEVMIVDEETRMSAETNSRAQTPAKQVVTSSDIVEESQSSVHSTGTTESGKTPSRPSKAPRLEVPESDTNVFTADLLSEYYWKGNGPFMLQEQVAQFLGIKSFKRKYPGIMRRMLDMQERDYIREQGLASENMCDLGLTAVNAADILDIMYTDFQEKYEEYCKHQRDRQAKELINKQKALSLATAQDKCKADITEQAIHSAAQWNARFNKTRKETRKTCMDLQNLTVHYPKGKMVPAVPAPHPGNYPVALVPGQFAEFYQEFTPTEINNLPINTMCYEEVTFIPREESEDSSSDGSESDSDSSDSSSSSSDSDSSSGIEDCKLCKHSPKKTSPATTVAHSGTPATPVK